MGISDRIRQLNEQRENQRRAYCEARDSLPWVHREAAHDYVYGEALMAPFEGAVPFGIDAKGNVHAGFVRSSYVVDKNCFADVKKPFLFGKKKPIFKKVFWVYQGNLYSKDFGRTFDVGKNQKYGHRVLSQSIVPFIESWNMDKLYKFLLGYMGNGNDARTLKFEQFGIILNNKLQAILDKVSSVGYTRYNDIWKVPTIDEIKAETDKQQREWMINMKKTASDGLNNALKDMGAYSKDGIVVQVGDHNHYNASIY